MQQGGKGAMNDDLDAIRRVLAADVESFRRLVERYQRPLLTLIRNLTPPDTDHEGVAQEVFLAAFRSLVGCNAERTCTAIRQRTGGWDRSVAGCRVRIMVCDTARRPGVGDCDACPCFPTTMCTVRFRYDDLIVVRR